jgi:hypothetical protein
VSAEISATIDCLITINKTFIFCQKKSFFLIFSVVIVIWYSLFYLIFPFGFEIVHKSEKWNLNVSFYVHQFNHFGSTKFYKTIYIIDSSIREGIFLIIIMILNGFIISLLKKSTQRRRILVGNNRNNDNTLLRSSQNAERKRMKMIVKIV